MKQEMGWEVRTREMVRGLSPVHCSHPSCQLTHAARPGKLRKTDSGTLHCPWPGRKAFCPLGSSPGQQSGNSLGARALSGSAAGYRAGTSYSHRLTLQMPRASPWSSSLGLCAGKNTTLMRQCFVETRERGPGPTLAFHPLPLFPRSIPQHTHAHTLHHLHCVPL